MGIYFSADIVYGLPFMKKDGFNYDTLEEFYSAARDVGLDASWGGDAMNGVDDGIVVHARGGRSRLFHSENYDGDQYGIHKIEEFEVEQGEVEKYMEFCERVGVEFDIRRLDYYVMNNVE